MLLVSTLKRELIQNDDDGFKDEYNFSGIVHISRSFRVVRYVNCKAPILYFETVDNRMLWKFGVEMRSIFY